MGKKIISAFLSLAVMVPLFSACSDSSKTQSTANQPSADRQIKITYWHHDGNATTNEVYKHMLDQFMQKNPNIKVEYLGLPADSFYQKYLTAIATKSGPDTYGMRQGDLSSLVAQKGLEPLDEYVKNWDQFSDLDKNLIDSVRSTAPDKKLYLLPQFCNYPADWYNVKEFEKKGITPPKTISEFLEDCKKYADPKNGKYFYTIRGNSGYINVLRWLFTYTGSVGSEYGLFNQDGTCIFRDKKYAEALDAYASIYKNNWCSKDSISANYKEMVAEFGSGTSMYISHDSSSALQHKTNLGDGNFMNTKPVANDKNGKSYVLALDAIGACVSAQSKEKDAAFRFVSFLSEEEANSYQAEKVGKIPANKLVENHDWFKNNKYMQVYPKLKDDPNMVYVNYPLFLPKWKDFQKIISDDLQAIFLNKTTSEKVLEKWSTTLEGYYKAYKAS